MKFTGLMKMAHLSTRREREGDSEDGPLAADVKLEADLPINRIKGLFSSNASFDLLLGNLFDEDENLITTDIKVITLVVEAPRCKVMLAPAVGTDELHFDEAKFNKITIEPMQGRMANVTARIQTHVTDDELGRLGSMLKHTIDVKISGKSQTPADDDDQEKLALTGGGAQADAEPESDGSQVH